MIMRYPRQIDSKEAVNGNDWNQNAPFGHCPACGSIGIEELHTSGGETIYFYCSDPMCKTIRDGMVPMQTKWNVAKPEKMQKRERKSGWSWNQEHWPEPAPQLVCAA